MVKDTSLAVSEGILEKELTAEQSKTICDMRSSGQSIEDIRSYLVYATTKSYSSTALNTFFKQNLINKNDIELRKQITVGERLRKLEKYRRSDYVANVIEKTISALNDSEFADLRPKDRIQAIVDLSKIMLETISKEAYAAAANGESGAKTSANVQINLTETMTKIAKEKSDIKKDILSSAKFDSAQQVQDVEVIKEESIEKE